MSVIIATKWEEEKIQIWLKNKNITEPTKFKIIEKYHGKLLFKSHNE